MASKLKIAPQTIDLRYNNERLADDDQMQFINARGDPEVTLHMQIQYVRSTAPGAVYKMPSQIQVQIVEGDGNAFRVITVDVERPAEDSKKPFLGGFRHKKTALVYHHAAVQTISTRQPPAPKPKNERSVQTQILESKTIQTNREAGTQMNRPGLWIDDARDRWVESRPYVDAVETLAFRSRMAIKIQCFVRCWLACRRVSVLRQARYDAQVAAMYAADEVQHCVLSPIVSLHSIFCF